MRYFSVPATKDDFKLSSYRFDLPSELIAQEPSARRGESRLFLLDRQQPANDRLTTFAHLAELLPPHSLLVANNSKVIPARILGQRSGGGALELLLLTPPLLLEAGGEKSASGWTQAEAESLIRPSKKIKTGQTYQMGNGLAMEVREKLDFGKARIILSWEGSLLERIWENGKLPLPPYIRRDPTSADMERYQTIYADAGKAGSMAAPTAGLHFTPEISQSLLDAGHDWAEITLFVGYSTFSPVRAEDIREHPMHAEYAQLDAATLQKIMQAKEQGRPVIAVGTTSARVLEAVAEAQANGPNLLAPHDGWLNCFIYPGRPIRVIDGLLTNFHLPESTLLMLVSALTGRERILKAYATAIENGFRFFSYGDAMLIR